MFAIDKANKARILVVAGDPVDRSFLEGLLAPLGGEVSFASSLPEMAARAAEEKPDLVMLDAELLQEGGAEDLSRFRTGEATGAAPVLLIVGRDRLAERVKLLEYGADDLISWPIDELELAARIKTFVRLKRTNDRLAETRAYIGELAKKITGVLKKIDPFEFNLETGFQELLQATFFAGASRGPEAVFVGVRDAEGALAGWLYKKGENPELLVLDCPDLCCPEQETVCSNRVGELFGSGDEQTFSDPLLVQRLGIVRNFVGYRSDPLVMLAFNYPSPVSGYEEGIFRNLMAYGHFLKVVSDQVKEVENAFLYTVGALARAAEANDEETGNHIQRVGVLAGLLAGELGCPASFVKTIEYSARMHDVGKIHIHPDILRKPGPLSAQEWETVKLHTVYGARILGDEPKLAMAREIALSHHEKWDGSGYPRGLKGGAIPLAARIAALVDIYDALRNKRSYKPAYPHGEACRIIAEGDGRVEPSHFDPEVLNAFLRLAPVFEQTYERLKDRPAEA